MTSGPATRDLVMGCAQAVRAAVTRHTREGRQRRVHGDSPGGDAQFDVDEVAERAVWDHLTAHTDQPLAVYTEHHGLRHTGADPEVLLVVDPIDGTRPMSAALEMATVSIAVAPLTGRTPTLGDVTAAHVLELRSGGWMYADDTLPEPLHHHGYDWPLPRLSTTRDLTRMFWSIEFNGHPMRLMTDAYEHLVDASANTGGVFVFNSASFSLTRIVTGQLDAYVDVGNRILRDHPQTEAEFRRAGRGGILHLFPYDIAASVYLADRAGVVVTDAYGAPLDPMPLLAIDPASQRSCVAASTPDLHRALLDTIRWDLRNQATTGGHR
ncbi:inositol monophosphatase family protein [Micromonospora sp. NPDC092111]|uniref:inositol monophosphatase family protein n=1 Tax=Micromonospora sp. NPDC092111 TaxID=3364289 RepID=UPI0038253353